MQNTEYVCVSGVKRKNEQWTAQDTEVIQFKTKEEAERLETDPMFRVEYGGADAEKARDKVPSLLDLKVCELRQAQTMSLCFALGFIIFGTVSISSEQPAS